uniref:Protein kinase domain-containing protein n=1 Tax=Oryza brachyantha TaxID=4533 RepID=J3LQG3_ORYBR
MARRWWRIKLKEELEKQHDLKETYKARLESTQAYLRFCLEVAHEHGFLHLASSSNDDDESSSPPHDAGDEPATAAADDDNGDEEDGAEAPICDPHFAATRDLAVQHVWSVSPDEFFLADPSHGEAFFAQELDALSRQRDLHEETPMVVHRNLKPNNELLDGDLRVRVANFGHARFLPDGGTKVLT